MTFARDSGSCSRATLPCVQLHHVKIPPPPPPRPVSPLSELLTSSEKSRGLCAPPKCPHSPPVGRPWLPAPCPRGKGPRPETSRPPVGSAPCLSGPRALLDVGGGQGERGQRLSQRRREKGETEGKKETEARLGSRGGTRGEKSRLGHRLKEKEQRDKRWLGSGGRGLLRSRSRGPQN